MSNNYTININAGSSLVLPIEWKDQSGAAYNMSGYTARMQIRRNINSPDYQIELTTENGRIQFINAAAGTFKLFISASDTAGLQNGVYDLEVEDSSGVVTRLLEGQVNVSKEVTR